MRVEPHSYDLQVDATVLEGTYEVDGTTCKTAFLMLVEHLQDYTPEFQETVTGLPAADCVELARELEKADAIFYDIAYGMCYRNQGEIHRAVTLLSMLTGSVGKPGAGCGYPMAMN